MRRALSLPLVWLLGGCGGDRAARTFVESSRCGWSDSTRLSARGIGDLRIGVSAADLVTRCSVVRDTTEFREGQPGRVIYVRVGPGVAYAEIVQDSVWRIGTRDSLVRTRDGLGVGTALGTLLADCRNTT
jgi:hypothetical protein